MDFLSLDPLLRSALQEDLGRGDITTGAILQESDGRSSPIVMGRIQGKENFVLAGWPVFVRVFQILGGVESEVFFGEGSSVSEGTIGLIKAEASLLLKAERVALNFLQRMCGIATQTRKYVDLIAHTRAKLLDTRKTTPLWRSLEKYSVRMGGGQNHRMGLDDGVLIKENHICVAGGLKAAIEACRRSTGHLQKIEVEVTSLDELTTALEADADVVLLDNMSVHTVNEAVQLAKGRCLLEVSGGIDESNIVKYAETGVDFISMGSLTHSYRSADISMVLESRS